MKCLENHLFDLLLSWYWLIFSAFYAFYCLVLRRNRSSLVHLMAVCIGCTRVLVGGFYVTCLVQDISRGMFWVAFSFEVAIQLVYFIGGVSALFFF
jgi:ABC-type transporter Mla maintaining outer membrane lipid asymmetry permease subunit MlaE